MILEKEEVFSKPLLWFSGQHVFQTRFYLSQKGSKLFRLNDQFWVFGSFSCWDDLYWMFGKSRV